MKKILAALLVLAIVAPAMADVAITSSFDNATKNLTISFNPTGASVRGAAVTVTVTGADVDAYVSSSFNTFVDYAFSTGATYTIGMAGQHPLAKETQAGVIALPVVSGTPFAVSVGYLAPAGQLGLTSAGTVAVLHLANINAAGGTVAVVANATRGGAVVGDTIGAVTVTGTTIPAQACTVSQPTLVKAVNPGFVNTDSTSIQASATSSLGHALEYSFNWGSGAGAYGAATQTNTYAFTAAGTETVTVVAHCTVDGAVSVASAPMTLTREAVKTLPAAHYSDWVAIGRPICWAYSRNCRGDINGIGTGSGLAKKWITGTDLTAFKAAYNIANSALPVGGVCADNNHVGTPTTYSGAQKRVTGTDLTQFKLYYNQAESGPVTPVTICPATNYNFWTN